MKQSARCIWLLLSHPSGAREGGGYGGDGGGSGDGAHWAPFVAVLWIVSVALPNADDV